MAKTFKVLSIIFFIFIFFFLCIGGMTHKLHKHIFKDTIIAPTCDQDGYTIHNCIKCNYFFTDSIKEKLNHSKTEWSIIKKPTCFSDGIKQEQCSFCNQIISTTFITNFGHHHFNINNYSLDAFKNVLLNYQCEGCDYSYNEYIHSSLKPDELKVASFNIAKCVDFSSTTTEQILINPNNVSNFLKEDNFDIIGLQEINVNRLYNNTTSSSDEDDQLKYIANSLSNHFNTKYYYCFGTALVKDEKNPLYINEYGMDQGLGLYGIGLISKFPILNYRIIPLAFHEGYIEDDYSTYCLNDYERRILLIADILVGDQIITVINTHFDLYSDVRIKSISVLENELSKINNPIILLGDFNAKYNSQEIKYINRNLLTSVSYLNAYNPTFPSDNPNKQIDWIFVSDDFKYSNFKIHKTLFSDHCCISITLNFKII